jgi:hypothetical protein
VTDPAAPTPEGHWGSCRIFYAEKVCTCGAIVGRAAELAATVRGGHECPSPLDLREAWPECETCAALDELAALAAEPQSRFRLAEERAEAAEAENPRLRAALERIARRYCLHSKGDRQADSACLDKPSDRWCSICIARAALAAATTPNPQDDGPA